MLNISWLALMVIFPFSQWNGLDSNEKEKSYLESLMEFDANKDGVIAKDELPVRLHKNFDKWDKNNNGRFDPTEMQQIVTAAVEDQDLQSGGNDRGRPGRQTRSGGPGLSRGPEGRRGRAGRPPGPPTANEFVKQAMTFDADGNGELNEAELLAAANDFLRNMPPPPGQRRGHSEQGFEFQRNNSSGGGRPSRSSRPKFDK